MCYVTDNGGWSVRRSSGERISMHPRRRRCRESIKRRESRKKKSDEEELRMRRRKIRKRKRKEEEKNGYSIMYCCCCCCVCYFGTFQQFSSRDFAFHPPPLPTILRAVELFSGSLIDRVRFKQTRQELCQKTKGAQTTIFIKKGFGCRQRSPGMPKKAVVFR